jgi:hypothetical protein
MYLKVCDQVPVTDIPLMCAVVQWHRLYDHDIEATSCEDGTHNKKDFSRLLGVVRDRGTVSDRGKVNVQSSNAILCVNTSLVYNRIITNGVPMTEANIHMIRIL